ncbi:hypothetical protein [Oligosphaera ethanolica]|uniref:Uncharacterized protein n=1 Tax=Oligosphaera ethanolica TaxID=760260 RepID=A0AAE4ANR0_9BACT|nr:hypothetical protein [Oligosphaera ethanolica]MDQ0288612.1 hypothetical protein [Oligosphaera ethanolica]
MIHHAQPSLQRHQLLFLLAVVTAALCCPDNATAQEREPATASTKSIINLWSGCEQPLLVPADAAWAVISDHGRKLFSGKTDGEQPVITLPALPPDTRETAVLTVNGQVHAKLIFWPPQLLDQCQAVFADAPGHVATALKQLGIRDAPDRDESASSPAAKPPARIQGSLPFTPSPGLTLVFPDRWSFPCAIADDWRDITLHHAKKPGTLSVIYDKHSRSIDANGALSYVVLKKHRSQCVIFSPDFSLTDIDNALLVKAFLEEKQP